MGAEPQGKTQPWLAAAGLLVLAAGSLVLGAESWRQGLLLALGGLIGALWHLSGFDFAAAWRRAVLRRDVCGVVAQLILLGATLILFAPSLGIGEAFGQVLAGAAAPVGVAVLAGSVLFGLGMQWSGGCAPSLLAGIGSGVRPVAALVAFAVGAAWASHDAPWWSALPEFDPVILPTLLRWKGALPIQLGLLILLWTMARLWAGEAPQAKPRGPVMAAVGLAALGWAVLAISGHPWTIVPGTARAIDAAAAPSAAVWATDTGIVLGALAAAAPAGRLRPSWRAAPRELGAAVAGGLLMGYGAGISSGCNIGGLVAAVASGSLDGWLWLAGAVIGSLVGIRMRPIFGLRD